LNFLLFQCFLFCGGKSKHFLAKKVKIYHNIFQENKVRMRMKHLAENWDKNQQESNIIRQKVVSLQFV